MNKPIYLLLMITVFFLDGCTLAPPYTRPDAPVPSKWPADATYIHLENAADEESTPLAVEISWEKIIPDERLKRVMEIALLNNRDLRMAALTVEKAKAIYGIGKASLLPSVNADGTWYNERIPADISSTGSSYTVDQYSVNLGITAWEIDFFGRIRSLKDKALEEYLATNEAFRSVQLLLVSNVTQAYLALAAHRELFQLVSKTLEAQEEAYQLIRKRYNAGMISDLDLRRAQTTVDIARGDVAHYKRMAAQAENGLNLLAGVRLPQELMPDDLQSVNPPLEVSAGLSSEVLLQRPDILAAEHQLKAVNANIGAARAAFLPRISLTAALGTASHEISGLFTSGSDTWKFVPQIIMPIFDARTWFAYDVTKIEKEMYVANYEKAIQTAFREVADALILKSTIHQQIAAQKSLVEALQETQRLAELRYAKGIDSYLSVLDAQRSLYSAQQGLIMLRLAGLNNRIVLYQTLGGGVYN